MRNAHAEVEAVFGPSVPDHAVAGLAAASRLAFVRNQTQVGFANEAATGRALTAFECLYAFGRETMAMLAEHNVVPFVRRGGQVGAALKARREALGLDVVDVSERLGKRFCLVLGVEDLRDMEAGAKKVPVRVLMKLARVLAIDAWRVGAQAADHVHPPVEPFNFGLGKAGILDAAEAAWEADTCARLAEWLGLAPSSAGAEEIKIHPHQLAGLAREACDRGLISDDTVADLTLQDVRSPAPAEGEIESPVPGP